MSTITEEKFQFQAETKQLLDLMIHSIYSNKEIFLRELISNGSDALDKLRFESLTSENLKTDDQLEIRIEVDKKSRLLKITDNGIGMSKEELIENIGTIAKSGTKELMAKLQAEKSNNAEELIGQFGVGFYSAFMAADKITLETKRAGSNEAWLWESEGAGEYILKESGKSTSGTEITLHLKPADQENGLDDFAEYWSIESVVKKYSDFINYPVILVEEKEEKEKDEEGKEIEDGKTETVIEDRVLNSMKPIWLRDKKDIKDEDYNEFYKLISHDYTDPLEKIAIKAEGTLEYTALLYLPAKAPFDLFYPTHESGLRLYAKRVLIMEKCEELLPKYLRFVSGIVDSSDLPLNISREVLQKNKVIRQIQKKVTSKILDSLAKLQKNKFDDYLKFWKELGSAIKEGVGSDFDNKEKLTKLLLFTSSNHKSDLTSMTDYFSRMKPEQKEIYFLTGENREMVENSPHLEAFVAKGYEVLFLTDPVDELVVQGFTEFEGKPLKSIGKGQIDLGDEKDKEKKEKDLKEKKEQFSDLLEVIQKSLDENVKEVRISQRLVSSPVCLVGEDNDMSPNLEKLLANSNAGFDAPKTKRILEINTEHELLKKMQTVFEKDKGSNTLKDYAELLYGYALLAEGSELKSSKKFNEILTKVMVQAV